MTAAIRQPIGTGLAPGVARVEVTELGRCAILILQLFFAPATRIARHRLLGAPQARLRHRSGCRVRKPPNSAAFELFTVWTSSISHGSRMTQGLKMLRRAVFLSKPV